MEKKPISPGTVAYTLVTFPLATNKHKQVYSKDFSWL